MFTISLFFLMNILDFCNSENGIEIQGDGMMRIASHSGYGYVIPNDVSTFPQHYQLTHNHKTPSSNPLFEALLLSRPLGIPSKFTGYNTLEHPPINPYIALLLSHYGRYVALPGAARGIYSYGAGNNYHNNKPFGSYKISEETDS
ncbi:hypothetical protein WA026_014527 [Henosepilachna vigintioctopunctata]|uniref:Uncharacterized protein n=1 Tax=Henosepilachna vigintioctopunctata TaxID=420089 RepID=A0AAW1UDW4_9CUCU